MPYTVKEIFYTLQGEGHHAGRPAVFCRFTGCNLWSGREEDRATAACRFCDTDFVGGKKHTMVSLAHAIASAWPGDGKPFVVFTGGEPLLQLDADLIATVHSDGFEVAVETNGTLHPPLGIDWLCMSPKGGTTLAITRGDELKYVIPQGGISLPYLESLDFRYFTVQPMDGPDRERNTQIAVQFCLHNPRWRLSIQTHKLLGLR